MVSNNLKIYRFTLCLALLLSTSGVVVAKDEIIKLPEPGCKGRVSLEEGIAGRRSHRKFAGKGLTLAQISQLLWAVQGITAPDGRRSAPSAGALYPLEIYLVTKDGLFYYGPSDNILYVLSREDLRKELARASMGQRVVEYAPVSIIICAEYARVGVRYGNRAERYVHIEVGHAAQNLHLQATVLGLGSVPIGSFDDSAVKNLCLLPKEYEPLYIIPVGYPE